MALSSHPWERILRRKSHIQRLICVSHAALTLAAAALADGGAFAQTPPTGPAPALAQAGGCIGTQQASFERGLGLRWHRQPGVVILASEASPLIADAREAVDYWNRQLNDMNSGLRLGPVRVASNLTPEDGAYAKYLSRFALSRPHDIPELPPAKFEGYCGNIVVLLTGEDFISFARPILRYGIAFAGIKGAAHYPFTLPNVPRNVIAHEIGHAIGLRHNADGEMLMCGRPASCRPDAKYPSPEPRFFPLTEDEKELLRRRYPAGWTGGR